MTLTSETRPLVQQLYEGGYPLLIGTSPPMLELFSMIAKTSQSNCPVLIEGESGTGKELVARSIHQGGPLASKPFLPIDCGSLVSTLIESELFGYERGAFTGAVGSRKGLLEAASGGTVFLDEIGEMPLGLQAKLLRTLQEKEVRPVGSNHSVKIDARIISATNVDLEMAVCRGQFRSDLYFRLNVLRLWVPPLRERKGDIPMLTVYALEKCRPAGMQICDEAMNCLISYGWPGNVRELLNCIEGAATLAPGQVLQCNDLPMNVRKTSLAFGRTRVTSGRDNLARVSGSDGVVGFRGSFSTEACDPRQVTIPEGGGSTEADGTKDSVIPLRSVKKQAILHALRQVNGDRLLAAHLLGIGKTTIYRKLTEYGWQGCPEKTGRTGQPGRRMFREGVQPELGDLLF
jgi:two-component system response regulator HydG